MSREHVFGDWMARVFPDDDLVGVDHFHRYEDLDSGDLEKEGRWAGDAFAHAVRDFCGKCNNGWMSRLEGEAKPLLSGAMMGEPIDLTVPDQYLLATWATKTVLVASLSVSGTKRLVPANLYRWFEKHQVPLPRSVISLSHYVGGDAAEAGQRGLFHSICTEQTSWPRDSRELEGPMLSIAFLRSGTWDSVSLFLTCPVIRPSANRRRRGGASRYGL